MKQRLTNIIANQCKFLSQEAKKGKTVLLVSTGAAAGGRTFARSYTIVQISLAEAERSFVTEKIGIPIGAVRFWNRKDEKIFEAHGYGERDGLLIVTMDEGAKA